jgi:uncharacterized protein YPO0396
MSNRHTFLILLAVTTLFGAYPASAQSIEDRLRDQLRATVQQLHQLQDDQASLQAQKAEAEQERDALKAQLAAAKAQLSRGGQDRGQVQALAVEVSKYKSAYTQATGTAAQAQADHDKLQAGLTNTQTLLTACQAKNDQLFKVGNEVLAAYQKFDFGDAFGANEPFIGFKRVELENLAQDYGDRLYDGKFDPRQARPATAPSQEPHK